MRQHSCGWWVDAATLWKPRDARVKENTTKAVAQNEQSAVWGCSGCVAVFVCKCVFLDVGIVAQNFAGASMTVISNYMGLSNAHGSTFMTLFFLFYLSVSGVCIVN